MREWTKEWRKREAQALLTTLALTRYTLPYVVLTRQERTQLHRLALDEFRDHWESDADGITVSPERAAAIAGISQSDTHSAPSSSGARTFQIRLSNSHLRISIQQHADQLGDRSGGHLVHEMGAMNLYRPPAQSQVICHLLVRLALHEQIEHLSLTNGE
jgi:hypothetical protein